MSKIYTNDWERWDRPSIKRQKKVKKSKFIKEANKKRRKEKYVKKHN